MSRDTFKDFICEMKVFQHKYFDMLILYLIGKLECTFKFHLACM